MNLAGQTEDGRERARQTGGSHQYRANLPPYSLKLPEHRIIATRTLSMQTVHVADELLTYFRDNDSSKLPFVLGTNVSDQAT